MKLLEVIKKMKLADKIKKARIAILPVLLSFLIAASGSVEEKIAVTKTQMESIGSAVEEYISDHGKAPEVFSMRELAVLLEQGYLESCPRSDAWGHDYYYTGRNIKGKDDRVHSEYWLGSGGVSCEFGGFLKYMTNTGKSEGDIIYSGGDFLDV